MSTDFADARNALVHRHVPTSVTVRIGWMPTYSIRVAEVDREVAVEPDAAYDIAVTSGGTSGPTSTGR